MSANATAQLQQQIDSLRQDFTAIQTRCERHEQALSSIDQKLDQIREELIVISFPVRLLNALLNRFLRLIP